MRHMKSETLIMLILFFILVCGPGLTLDSQEGEGKKKKKETSQEEKKRKEIEKRKALIDNAVKGKDRKKFVDSDSRESPTAEKSNRELKRPAKSITAGKAEALKAKLDAARKAKAAAANAKTGNKTANKTNKKKTKNAKPKIDPKKTQQYWIRLKTKREKDLQDAKQELEKMETRLKVLHTQLINHNLGNAYRKIKVEMDNLYEKIENYKRGVVTLERKLKNLPDEARKAGVPKGWVR